MNKVFKQRHSVRSFQDKKVSIEDMREIVAVAHSAPSAGCLRARTIDAFHTKKAKMKLAKASWNQMFITDASFVLVFCAIPSKSAMKYGERGELYAIQDATIACSFAMIQAEMLGLGTCWIGAFDENKVKEILNVNKEWKPIALLLIGYGNETNI